MADSDKTLTLLLQLKADVAAGRDATKAALQEIQVQATETARVVNSVGQTTVAVNPANVEAIAQSEARMATMLASQEKSAVNEALINAQMERRVIVETQLEAAEARIAGNPALAIRLEREAEIRTRALAIQRTLNITTEESIALAERMVVAQEASAVAANTMGINMAKAKTEALVLGREMAAGNVRASTMSSLLGSMGTYLTIAGIGAYELYQGFNAAQEAAEETSKAAQKLRDDAQNALNVFQGAADKSRTFADVAGMANRVALELSKMSVEMAEFRSKEVTKWQKFWEMILPPSVIFGFGPAGHIPTFEEKLNEDKSRALENYNRALEQTGIQLLQATGHAQAFQLALSKPAEFLPIYQQKLAEAQATFDKARQSLAQSYQSTTPITAEAREVLIKSLDAASGKLETTKSDVDKLTGALKKTSEGAKEFNALLRDQANILAQIRANQQGVQQNPFLSADQKNAAMLPLITQEAAALAEQLRRDQAEQSKLTDPAQWNRMQGAIIQAKARLAELGYEAQKVSFLGGVRAELTAWVNQFGSTAKQVSGIITGTLNTAISSTSAALTAIIFKTGNWKQAFAQAAQSIVQNIIQIGLQWVASRLLMSVLNAIFGKEDAAVAGRAGTQAAASWASAGVSASIATEGEAAGAGLAAFAAAVAAGTAIAVGMSGGSAVGAAQGWYVDRGTHSTADDVPAMVSRGEGIINARAVAAHGGRSWVDRINSNVTRPGFAGGGFMGSGSPGPPIVQPGAAPEVHIFNFTDARELTKAVMKSSAGRKIVVDTIKGVSWQL